MMWNLVQRCNFIFWTIVQLYILNNPLFHTLHQNIINLYSKILDCQILNKFHINSSNLHILCVIQKPVLYVVHLSWVYTCTKFQNVSIPIKGVLIKNVVTLGQMIWSQKTNMAAVPPSWIWFQNHLQDIKNTTAWCYMSHFKKKSQKFLKISVYKWNWTISGNKDGRQSAILDSITKSFEKKE